MLKFKFYDYKDSEKNCQAIKAVSMYEGKSVYGIAYQHPDDAYDFETGKDIAKFRCYVKVMEKKIKRYKRKKRIVQEDILYLMREMDHLSSVLKTYESILTDAEDEKAMAEAELAKVLEKVS